MTSGVGVGPTPTTQSDFSYYSEMLPPELARQLMMGELGIKLVLNMVVIFPKSTSQQYSR